MPGARAVAVTSLVLALLATGCSSDGTPSVKERAGPRSSTPPTSAPATAPTTAPTPTTSPSGAGCGGNNEPAIEGAWQTSAPRTPRSPAGAGSSAIELGLRLKEGLQGDGVHVVAVVQSPSGKHFSSAGRALPVDNEFLTIHFPDDFAFTGGFDPFTDPGTYTVAWRAPGAGTLACDSFEVTG